MKFLSQNSQTKIQIEQILKESTDIKLAVAFWGFGSNETIKFAKNKKVKIICNLESGATNPHELIKIGKMIDFNSIRSINNLHAKVYLSNNKMILSSSNFSANGLSLEGDETNKLIEANVLIDNQSIIKQANLWFNLLWKGAKEIDEKYCQKFISKWSANRKRNTTRKIQNNFFKNFENGEYSNEKIYIIIDSEALTKEQEKIGNKAAKDITKGDLFYAGKEISYWWGYYAIPREAKIINYFCGERGGVYFTGIWETLPKKYDRKGYQFCYKTAIDTLSKKQINQIKMTLKQNIKKIKFVDYSAEIKLSEFYRRFKP